MKTLLAVVALCLAAGGGLPLGGLRYFSGPAGLPPEMAVMHAQALALFLQLLLLPQLVCALAPLTAFGVLKLTGVGGLALMTAQTLAVWSFWALPGQCVLLCAAACMVLAALLLGRLAAALLAWSGQMLCALRLRRPVCAFALLFAVGTFSSVYWTGPIGSGSELGESLAVWLSVPAVIAGGREGFSYAYLPDVYRLWLGPLAPVPQPLAGCLYYLIPSLLMLLALLFLERRGS